MTLISHWPLQEDSGSTAYDVRGSNDGTINGATVGQTGILGNTAYSFDGTDDNVAVSSFSIDVAGSTGLTYSIWLKPDFGSSAGTRYDPLSWAVDGNNNWGIIYRSSNEWQFRWSNSNIITSASHSAGDWLHLVGTVTASGSYTAYIDTVQVGTASVGSATGSSTLRFGANENNNYHFDGSIADVRVYDHALTPQELQYLYHVVSSQARMRTDTKTS